ncbi:MAG: hypothetical protein AAF696_15070 [Bacteroidota bacterium]
MKIPKLKLYIHQTDAGDADKLLDFLKKSLSDEITKRTQIFEPSLYQKLRSLPKIFAGITDLSQQESDIIKAVFSDFGISGFELIEEIPVWSPNGTTEEAFFLPNIDSDQMKAIQSQINSLSDKLKKFFSAKASGEDWPENKYGGTHKEVYDFIVLILAKTHNRPHPKDNKGDTISFDEIRRIKRPDELPEEIWEEVVEHLRVELQYFAYAKDWFADSGHLRTFLLHQREYNRHFISKIAADYVEIPGKKVVTIYFDQVMKLVTVSVGALNSAVGTLVSIAWDVAKATAQDKISGKISELETILFENFSHMIHKVELAHGYIRNDWGKLEEFGRMLQKGEIHWPTDAKPLRAAASIGFHSYALKTLLLLSDYQYIVDQIVSTSKETARKFDPKNGIYTLSTHSEKGRCNRWYHRHLYIGKLLTFPDGTFMYSPAPTKLHRKLFGLNQNDDIDPEFRLPAGFYLDPKGKERKSWPFKHAMPPDIIWR